jgi:hypothetical protein
MDNMMKEGKSMMDNNRGSNDSSNQSSDMQNGGNDSSSGGGIMDSMKSKGENAYVNNGEPPPLQSASPCHQHQTFEERANTFISTEANDMMDKAGVPEGMDSKVDGVIDGGMKRFE